MPRRLVAFASCLLLLVAVAVVVWKWPEDRSEDRSGGLVDNLECPPECQKALRCAGGVQFRRAQVAQRLPVSVARAALGPSSSVERGRRLGSVGLHMARPWIFYVARRYETQIVVHSTANRTVIEGLRCYRYQRVRTRFREQVFLRRKSRRWVAVGPGYAVTAYTEDDLNGILDSLQNLLAAGQRPGG